MARIKRSMFTDSEIREAARSYMASTNCETSYSTLVNAVAAALTALNRGAVSAATCRYWLRQLKMLPDKTPGAPRGPYTKAQPAPPVESRGPQILSLDIETSPIEGRVWGLFKQNVGLNQIVKDWNLLSFCAKWLHDEEPIYHDLRDAENIADDSILLHKLWALLDQADIVIAQNGKRFDVPKINARFVALGLLPPSPYKVIDTLLMAKQQFGFTSKKLEYMTDKLCTTKKRKHERFPGMELWNQCLAGNPEAWEEMRVYNIDDVISMEELYLIMRPWYVGHPNVAIYYRDQEATQRCPKCGSTDIKQDGVTYTQSGEYERMHCGGCGGWSRGRYTLNSKEVRRVLLSN